MRFLVFFALLLVFFISFRFFSKSNVRQADPNELITEADQDSLPQNSAYKFLRIIYYSKPDIKYELKNSLLLQVKKDGDIIGLVKTEDKSNSNLNCQKKGVIQKTDFYNLHKLITDSEVSFFLPCEIDKDTNEEVCIKAKNLSYETVTLFTKEDVEKKLPGKKIFLDINTLHIHKNDYYFKNGGEIKIRLQQFFNNIAKFKCT